MAEIFGSSDSESVLDFDYRNVGGGDSDSFEEKAAQPEDLYSGDLIRRKELKPNSEAEKSCIQCKLDGRQNVFTKWVCSSLQPKVEEKSPSQLFSEV